MEPHSLKGKVEVVFDLEQKTEKFRKREFVVEVNSTNERGTFIDYIKLQAINSNIDQLSHVSPGDLVVVRYAIAGRKWGKKGQEKYFTNVEALEITVVSKSQRNAADDAIEDQFPMGQEDADPIGASPAGSYDDGPDDLPF
jgi:hypothetical protein